MRVAAAAPWYLGTLAVVLVAVGSGSAGAGVSRLSILLVLAPLAEEAVFRAGLQEALLQRWNAPRLANGVTALVFGLAHAVLLGQPAAFAVAAPALLIGAAYQRWRQLRLCVALHAAMNALWLLWAL